MSSIVSERLDRMAHSAAKTRFQSRLEIVPGLN
jgi:hypothetical protein